jgi:hypothetical protein
MEKKDKTKVTIITQEDIDKFNSAIGYRIARKKRYGKSASERKKEQGKSK